LAWCVVGFVCFFFFIFSSSFFCSFFFFFVFLFLVLFLVLVLVLFLVLFGTFVSADAPGGPRSCVSTGRRGRRRVRRGDDGR
jgi:hypothetical protein